jgi:uncharacterized membrane protein
MSVTVTSSVDIARPAAEVFDYVSDFENNPRWQGGMKSAQYTSEGPLAVGSTYDQIAKMMGKTIVTSFVVTALEPGLSVTIESTSGSFPIQVTRSVEATGEGTCRARALVEGQPGGFFKLMGPLMHKMVESSVRKDWANLKQLMEGATEA